ncbi:hypothetical protein LTR32_003837 [Rachicladosporium monterosium]|uniref:NADP-dependent oxidoreductase domain-containing protein n=1 Tax=Rachicladosporium monterosium TaxID=1507873 RepID=A0ABR0L6C9_9PEZI|nr:hypothetical protein LTR32_003837 [Rachicladosporium monterosium]
MSSQKYPTRKLGGEDVSAIGLGCMGMSFAYTSFGGYDDKASAETEFLKTARELGVKIVAYSPLGRGFLTGTIQSRDDLDPSDNRINHPRFAEGHFQENLKLVNTLSEVASKKGCTPSQLALAWVLAQGDDFLPIPGTKRVKYLLENAEATNIKLSKEEEANIRKAIDSVGGTKGERYPAAMMAKCFGDSPEQ